MILVKSRESEMVRRTAEESDTGQEMNPGDFHSLRYKAKISEIIYCQGWRIEEERPKTGYKAWAY